jgi:hypothetical protein
MGQELSFMPSNAFRQPLNRRGITLVEVALGIGILGIISVVIAGMLRAGVVTYNYTMGQLVVLRRTRQALDNPAASQGVVRALRAAKGASALSDGSIRIEPTQGPEVRFHLEQGALLSSQTGVSAKQADGIRSMEFKYYHLDENGRVVESAGLDSASLVVGTMRMSGGRSEHVTFSGAALRNR